MSIPESFAGLPLTDGLDTPSPGGSGYSTNEKESAGRVASASERIETTTEKESAGRVASASERIETTTTEESVNA
jgi:hypothetical protein